MKRERMSPKQGAVLPLGTLRAMRLLPTVIICLIALIGCSQPSKSDGMFADVGPEQTAGPEWEKIDFRLDDPPQPQERSELESRLKQNPADIKARSRLIYLLRPLGYRDAEAKNQHVAHCAWLIRNAPTCALVSHPYTIIRPRESGFSEVLKAWETAIQRNTNDVKVLWIASDYSILSDVEFNLKCAEQGSKLEPKDPRWPDRMARAHWLQIRGDEGSASRREPAEQSLKWLNIKIGLVAADGGYEEPGLEMMDRSLMALLTYEAQGAEAAIPLCRELVERAGSDLEAYASEFHEAHQVWGRAELAQGNTKGAIDHLLASARVPGSPGLDSFGPNLRLCNLLIDKGEREAAIDYLKLCANFWDGPPISDWIETLKSGGMPDYGNYAATAGT